MRPSASSATSRCILLAAALLLPATFVAGDPGAAEARELLPVALDGLSLPSGWSAEATEAGVRLQPPRGGGDGRATLRVAGAEAFAYEPRVERGAVEVYVDGALRARHEATEKGVELALTPGVHELAFRFAPDAGEAAGELLLEGARAAAAPVLELLPPVAYSECGAPAQLVLALSTSLPLSAAGIVVRVGEEEADATLRSRALGVGYAHTLTVPLRPSAHGAPAELDVLVEDALGTVWTLLRDALVQVELWAPLAAGPHGWVYDFHPTVHAFSPCFDTAMANAKLTLDGAEVPLERASPYVAAYRVPEALRFNEPHEYRFTLTLLDGSIVEYAGEFRGGLDVLEMEASRLALLFEEAAVQAQVGPLGVVAGEVVFANLAAPDELPPVSDASRRLLRPQALPTLSLDEPATLRAVYAPLGIACGRAPLPCSPYGGNAPGFDPFVARATLEVRVGDERIALLPGAGQFAAASRATAGMLAALEVDTGSREG